MMVVFAGPTLRHEEIKKNLDCVCLPPVRHGDVLQVLAQGPDAIGIIDGYFEGAPAVWHKEILYALDQGVRVYGCSSMGALRAAELQPFGMTGVGQIYEWYRDGAVQEDDEVAILHGPAEMGFIAASEPMVNIRATLALARQQQVIGEAEEDGLIGAAKKMFYKKRNWKDLLDSSIELFADKSTIVELKNWLEQNRVDLKKRDALLMLETMNRDRANASGKPEIDYRFEWTHLWDSAFREHGQPPASAKPLASNDHKVLDQLRLDPDQFERYRDQALLRWICNNRVEAPNSGEEVKSALKRFREINQLDSRAQLLDYMARTGLDESQLTVLLQSVSRVNLVRQQAGDLRSCIVDQLKLDGRYVELLDRANSKQERLRAAALDPDRPGVPPPQILAWYFEQRLHAAIPRPLETHLARIDLEHSDEFYRLIAADYLYWREDRR